jgi:glycyl-tRNA synthetase beta chain
LLGRFDEAFLEVPPEVIQLTARVNQKYFVVNGEGGKLANGFVCTANIDAVDGGAEIVAGNRKVLAARLSDARFFWEQDQKKTLARHAEKLANITFHEKLGTVARRVERIAKIARLLVERDVVLPTEKTPQAKVQLGNWSFDASMQSKADLVTEMVGEFPELQGLMGGYYARAEGLPDAVADAIRDHYKPVGQGDDVPTAPVTVALALADKLDVLFAFFAARERPTGSKDPFALRRAALGVVSLILTNRLRLNLLAIADQADAACDNFYRNLWLSGVKDYEDLSPRGHKLAPMNETHSSFAYDLLDFFADRLKVQQREAGVRHDLIDAVFALGGEDDLVRLLARVKALQAFMATEDGTNLLAGYKRAANILKQAGEVSGTAAATPPTDADAALLAALGAAEPAASTAVAEERFTDAMAALALLRAPIDAFFEGVMVNDPDEAVRAFRLGLLARFTGAVHGVADFSKIEG